ncbi:MAG: glycosyltransferase [Candidatus Eisenbacteria bacterium]|nr:glycosyltransferase [Candidatus Eisenbacteria bacterium]
MELSIVVVNYETPELLRNCLASILDYPPSSEYELLVIDNSRTHGSAALVRKEFPSAKLISNPANIGYGRAINQAIGLTDSSYLLVLNPDITVTGGAIDGLVSQMKLDKRIGICSAKLLNPDGTLQYSARTFYTLKTILLRRTFLGRIFPDSKAVRQHLMMDWDHSGTRAVDWLMGACLLVRREAIGDVGPVDERFFLYFEDVDWCYRMNKRGWKITYVSDSVMVHHHRRESAKLFGKGIAYHVRSLLLFYEKWSLFLYLLKKNREAMGKGMLFLVDILAINASFFVAYLLRAALGFAFAKPHFPLYMYGTFLVVTNVVTLASLRISGLYGKAERGDWVDELFGMGKSALAACLVLMASTYLLYTKSYSRFVVALLWPLMTILLTLGRAALRKAGQRGFGPYFAGKRILLIGKTKSIDEMWERREAAKAEGYEFLRPPKAKEFYVGPDGSPNDLISLVLDERIQEVVFPQEWTDDPTDFYSALARRGVKVRILSEPFHILTSRTRVEPLAGIPLLTIDGATFWNGKSASKRIFDFIVGTIGLILFSPLFLFRLLSAFITGKKGFNGVQKVGKGGVLFTHYDPAGGSLRLPFYLVNVVRGELSLIGPSALSREEWDELGSEAREILSRVRPGAFPAWRGSIGRSFLKGERLELDMSYVRRWSFFEDLKTLVRAVARRRIVPLSIIPLLFLFSQKSEAVPWSSYVNSNCIKSVASEGLYLWCATTGGVSRFSILDSTFAKINVVDGLASEKLTAVAIDDDGNKYFGTEASGISMYSQNGTWRLIEDVDGLPSNKITCLLTSHDSLWVGTADKGVVLLIGFQNPAIHDFVNTSGKIPSNQINTLFKARNGIYCGTSAGVSFFDGSSWNLMNTGLGNKNATSFAASPETVWVGCGTVGFVSGGVYKLSGSGWQAIGFWGNVTSLVRGTSSLLIGSRDKGVYRLYAGTFTDISSGLPSTEVLSLYTSDGLTVWAGTAKGLSFYDGSAWTKFISEGPVGTNINGLALEDGTIWTAAFLGGVDSFDGKTWRHFGKNEGLSNDNYFFSVFVDSRKNKWLGAYGIGLDRILADGTIDHYTPASQTVTNENIMSIEEDPSGNVWFGEDSRDEPLTEPIVIRSSDGAWSHLMIGIYPISSNKIKAIAFRDGGKERWIGHYANGVDVWSISDLANPFAVGSWTRLTYENGGLSENSVTSIVSYGDEVWVGTASGITVIRDLTKFRVYTKETDGLPSSNVTDIAVDKFGNKWVATDRGPAKIMADGTVARSFTSQWIVNSNVKCVAVNDETGEVWFGTEDGISRYQAWEPRPGVGGAYVYPNPLDLASGTKSLRARGFQGLISGKILTIAGEVVWTFGDKGEGEPIWDGKNTEGRPVASGVYVVRLHAGGETVLRKVAVLR